MELDRRHLTAAEAEAAQIDVGLRNYMLGVYNHMTIGLALTGFFALGTKILAMSSPAFAQLIFASPLKWVIMLAPLGMVFFLAARIQSMQAATARTTFFVYAGVMGVSMASIFFVFTGESIVRVFFITAAAFAGLSLFGYTTKRSLSGMGSFLFMGLIGILIASVVNIFMASTMLQFMISAGGVLVFAGLTAYDTQNIKNMYLESDGHEVATKKSVMGALQLYLDFIMMFQYLLMLFGNRE
ncbi:Bax inhibitor-1/YccA family protein [Nisaea acidiphila]|uniref:Bax inhibitor-1/YccA family protein n=1 Tax=Nisaea acidiphila TaxID=1862145 RepID=A0A9J7AMD9_9PROT|nr:Bax inhibitor-1/YccA family protein [Nisaea acidiphila]UUX48335.1 Bax inhibitor-1/YccA family protein [Nisaea acidiphila]